MEIKEMTIEEVLARKSELLKESEGAENERLAEIKSELEELNARKFALESAAEKREALVEEIKNNENTKVVKTMENEIRSFSVDSKEYREAFLKNLMGVQLSAEERTAVTATAAIPTETMNKIYAVLEDNALINSVDVTHFVGHVTLPAESSCADANWTDEASDSADALKAISLSAYQLIKTIEVKGDVARMHIGEFENYIVNRLANKMEAAICKAILVGSGADDSQPTGICVTKATADGTYTSTGITYADVCAQVGALADKYHKNAMWTMPSKVFYSNILGMVDTNKRPIVVADSQAPAKFNLLGYPVQFGDFGTANSTDIIFGDNKAYKLNIGGDVEVSSDDSVGFRKGSRVYRGLAYVDGKLADENAIIRYNKA